MSDMPDALPPDDARLVDDLRAALGPDPLPAGLLDRAAGLLGWMDVDHELATLLEEAAVEPSGTRGSGDATVMTYEVADGSVTVELVVGWGELRGQVLSGDVTLVLVERSGGDTQDVPLDELGQLAATGLPHGPARLRLVRGSALPVVTEWFVL
jgi:hypothetical protein